MVTTIIRGSTTAVPAPWKSRPSSRTPNHGASAASRVPSRNAATATMKTGRVENRSSIQPVVGMTTAIVSMKPVSSHWAVAAETWNSPMIAGRATATVVSLSIITKAVDSRTTRTPATGADSAAPLAPS